MKTKIEYICNNISNFLACEYESKCCVSCNELKQCKKEDMQCIFLKDYKNCEYIKIK